MREEGYYIKVMGTNKRGGRRKRRREK